MSDRHRRRTLAILPHPRPFPNALGRGDAYSVAGINLLFRMSTTLVIGGIVVSDRYRLYAGPAAFIENQAAGGLRGVMRKDE